MGTRVPCRAQVAHFSARASKKDAKLDLLQLLLLEQVIDGVEDAGLGRTAERSSGQSRPERAIGDRTAASSLARLLGSVLSTVAGLRAALVQANGAILGQEALELVGCGRDAAGVELLRR